MPVYALFFSRVPTGIISSIETILNFFFGGGGGGGGGLGFLTTGK